MEADRRGKVSAEQGREGECGTGKGGEEGKKGGNR